MNYEECVVVTNKKNIDSIDISKNVKVLYLEDYLLSPNNKKARIITENIFLTEKKWVASNFYKGFNLSWSVYDKVHAGALVATSLEKLFEKLCEFRVIDVSNLDYKYRNIISIYFFDKKILSKKTAISVNDAKFFIGNIVLLFFTIISTCYFKIKRGRYVGLWTGDYVYKKTGADFRMVNLYGRMEENNIRYIEFVRTHTIKSFIINTIKRKRLALYYFPINYFLKLFSSRQRYAPSNINESILMQYNGDIEISKKVINILIYFMKFLNINSIISTAFISRTSHFHLAGKISGVKTIGIMHGLTSRDYSVNEFIEVFQDKNKIGPDVFGVWSSYYRDYYKRFCKIVPHEKIFVSGPLRTDCSTDLKENKGFRVLSDKIKILLISEPLVDPIAMLGYIKAMVDSNTFDISIKIRPMVKDVYYEKLKNIYSGTCDLKVIEGNIFEVGSDFDIFVGSHSTAILEASLIGKLSLMCYTEHWQDHFNIKYMKSEAEMLCMSEKNIVNTIINRVENERTWNTINMVRERYFGNSEDGAQWVVDQIEA